MPLYIDHFSDLHKIFQVAPPHNTNLKYKIWSFCCYLFFQIILMTDLHTRINQPSKTLFSDSGELKRYKLIKIIVMKILPQDITLSTVHEKEKII